MIVRIDENICTEYCGKFNLSYFFLGKVVDNQSNVHLDLGNKISNFKESTKHTNLPISPSQIYKFINLLIFYFHLDG